MAIQGAPLRLTFDAVEGRFGSQPAYLFGARMSPLARSGHRYHSGESDPHPHPARRLRSGISRAIASLPSLLQLALPGALLEAGPDLQVLSAGAGCRQAGTVRQLSPCVGHAATWGAAMGPTRPGPGAASGIAKKSGKARHSAPTAIACRPSGRSTDATEDAAIEQGGTVK
jgi:hypothetical protein